MAAAVPAGREIEIVSILDVPSSSAIRLGKWDVMISYKIDPMHSFSITLPKENSSEKEIWDAIQADWNTRKHIIGAKRVLT
jgi:hypothetical protein